VVAVTALRDHAAVLDVDFDAAHGVAEATEGLVRLDHLLARGPS